MEGHNRIVLDACLLNKSNLKKTLAGVYIIEFDLEHESNQVDSAQFRQAIFTMSAVAIEDMANVIHELPAGLHYRFEGYLNRKSAKSTHLRLHVTHVRKA